MKTIYFKIKKVLKSYFQLGCVLFAIQFSYYNIFAQTNVKSLEFSYAPEIISPVYLKNKGPTIYLDEGHYNRHTYGGLGSFIAFRNVLKKDECLNKGTMASSKNNISEVSRRGMIKTLGLGLIAALPSYVSAGMTEID